MDDFEVGDEVMLTAEGREILHKNTLRTLNPDKLGMVIGHDKYQAVLVRLHGTQRVLPFKPEYLPQLFARKK